MKTVILIIALATLTSCLSVNPGSRGKAIADRYAAGVCDVLSPITYDGKLDTQPTKDQIKRYNAARNAFCATKGDVK